MSDDVAHTSCNKPGQSRLLALLLGLRYRQGVTSNRNVSDGSNLSGCVCCCWEVVDLQLPNKLLVWLYNYITKCGNIHLPRIQIFFSHSVITKIKYKTLFNMNNQAQQFH